ncbi:MAG: hypothetical protein MR455_08970 [Prevotella sp.]|nr:hypothetical protein [Prevotella sp.]
MSPARYSNPHSTRKRTDTIAIVWTDTIAIVWTDTIAIVWIDTIAIV